MSQRTSITKRRYDEESVSNLPGGLRKQYKDLDHELYDSDSLKRWENIRVGVFITITVFIIISLLSLVLSIIALVEVKKFNTTLCN